jgi:hypothetical protein
MRRAVRQDGPVPALIGALAVALGLAVGCASDGPAADAEIFRRAESEQISRLEREVERLRTDLSAAEQELVAAESGLSISRSRADASSARAEARIQGERAAERAPWRAPLLKEAEERLDQAERLAEAQNFGSAIFFAHRAARIARNTLEEARRAESEPGARIISGRRVNLRDGPSVQHAVLAVLPFGTPVFPERESEEWVLLRTADGSVGWVHRSLIR